MDGVGLELGVVAELVTVDGLEEADGTDLDQILDGIGAAAGETARNLLHQGNELVDESLTFLRGQRPLTSSFHA
ncbi:hypothetical protein D3C87_1963380 [compost metagenome]